MRTNIENVAFAHQYYFDHDILTLYVITKEEAERLGEVYQTASKWAHYADAKGRGTNEGDAPLFELGVAAYRLIYQYGEKGVSLKNHFTALVEEEDPKEENPREALGRVIAEALGLNLIELAVGGINESKLLLHAEETAPSLEELLPEMFGK